MSVKSNKQPLLMQWSMHVWRQKTNEGDMTAQKDIAMWVHRYSGQSGISFQS
ncbi:hypothetical protein GX50_02260 [[Emmonsia] crescens]|uniref:Uncharacterized protein n=1 Tax=[Emmonsia] crescens TaxID=73230 RepID=A0A2B7ZNZ7_9EURO|nr:hypothetical protein GX50_02260 [Emmonsia crescens]